MKSITETAISVLICLHSNYIFYNQTISLTAFIFIPCILILMYHIHCSSLLSLPVFLSLQNRKGRLCKHLSPYASLEIFVKFVYSQYHLLRISDSFRFIQESGVSVTGIEIPYHFPPLSAVSFYFEAKITI